MRQHPQPSRLCHMVFSGARKAHYFSCRYIRYRYIVSSMARPHTQGPESLLPLTPVVFSILLALAGSEKHGYAIMKEVSLPEGGGVAMGPGTLYGSPDPLMRWGL